MLPINSLDYSLQLVGWFPFPVILALAVLIILPSWILIVVKRDVKLPVTLKLGIITALSVVTVI